MWSKIKKVDNVENSKSAGDIYIYIYLGNVFYLKIMIKKNASQKFEKNNSRFLSNFQKSV